MEGDTEMFNDFSFNSTFDQEIVQVVCQNGSWFKCFFSKKFITYLHYFISNIISFGELTFLMETK